MEGRCLMSESGGGASIELVSEKNNISLKSPYLYTLSLQQVLIYAHIDNVPNVS